MPEELREQLENAVNEVASADAPVEEVNAPDTWQEPDKQYFSKIPDMETRKWVLNRDTDYNRRIGDYENRYKGFDEIFAPYKERLAASKQEPVSVIKNLLAAQDALEKTPREAFLWLAKTYGIDLASLVGKVEDKPAVEDEDPFANLDPNLASFLKDLKGNVDSFKGTIEERQKTEQQQAAKQLNDTITEFRQATDDKKQLLYPYLANREVTDMMSVLIRTGKVDIAKSGGVSQALKVAYDQAIYAVPAVREELLKTRETPITRDRLLRAKRAGASLSGVSASTASPAAKGSVREQLTEAARASGMIE